MRDAIASTGPLLLKTLVLRMDLYSAGVHYYFFRCERSELHWPIAEKNFWTQFSKICLLQAMVQNFAAYNFSVFKNKVQKNFKRGIIFWLTVGARLFVRCSPIKTVQARITKSSLCDTTRTLVLWQNFVPLDERISLEVRTIEDVKEKGAPPNSFHRY